MEKPCSYEDFNKSLEEFIQKNRSKYIHSAFEKFYDEFYCVFNKILNGDKGLSVETLGKLHKILEEFTNDLLVDDKFIELLNCIKKQIREKENQ